MVLGDDAAVERADAVVKGAFGVAVGPARGEGYDRLARRGARAHQAKEASRVARREMQMRLEQVLEQVASDQLLL